VTKISTPSMVIRTRKALCTASKSRACHMPNHRRPRPRSLPRRAGSPASARRRPCSWHLERAVSWPELPSHRNSAECTKCRDGDLCRDNQNIAGMVKDGRRHRAPMNARHGRDLIHVEHIGDKGKVRPIVRDIAESDQRHVKSDGGDAANLGKAYGKHAGPPCAEQSSCLA